MVKEEIIGIFKYGELMRKLLKFDQEQYDVRNVVVTPISEPKRGFIAFVYYIEATDNKIRIL